MSTLSRPLLLSLVLAAACAHTQNAGPEGTEEVEGAGPTTETPAGAHSKRPSPSYSGPRTMRGSGYVFSAAACWLADTTPGMSCVSGSSSES